MNLREKIDFINAALRRTGKKRYTIARLAYDCAVPINAARNEIRNDGHRNHAESSYGLHSQLNTVAKANDIKLPVIGLPSK